MSKQTLVIEDNTEPEASGYPDRWAAIPPNNQTCQHTGLGHAKLYGLVGPSGIARKHVRVANLKPPGATRGKTIFHVGDMFKWLDSIARGQSL